MADPTMPVGVLNISIRTGEDDVRTNSHVLMYTHIKQGSALNTFSVDMNRGRNWSNGSTNTGTLPMPPGTTLGDIREFGVHFSSGQSGPFDTPDNWNMDSIQVTYKGPNGEDESLVNQEGVPLHRFKGGNPVDWIVQLS